MTLDELESKPIQKLKDIRMKQLELLKPGFTVGTYWITVTSFDGRVIERLTAPDHKSWNALYIQKSHEWERAAYVNATIELDIH